MTRRREPTTLPQQSAFSTLPADTLENDLADDDRNANGVNSMAQLGVDPLRAAAGRIEEDEELADWLAENDAIASALAETGSDQKDGLAVLHRMTPKGRQWLDRGPLRTYVDNGGPAWIAREFGAGDYELTIYNAERKIVKGGRQRFSIDQATANYQKKKAPVDLNAQATVVPHAQSSDIAQMAAVMMQGFQQLGQMIAAQGVKGDNGGDHEEAFLRRAAMYKSLFGVPATAPAPAENNPLGMIETFLKFQTVIQRNNGEAPERSNLEIFADIAREYAPALTEAFKGAVANGAQAGQIPRQITAQHNGAVQAAPAQGGDVNFIYRGILKSELRKLVRQAEKGSDPELYAEVLYNELDEVPQEFIHKFVADPNWFPWLASFEPAIGNHQAWFTALREKVIEIIQEEAEEEQRAAGLTPGTQAATNAGTEIADESDVSIGHEEFPD